MTFDELGLPREGIGGDWQDSSRLAGVMALVGYYPNGDLDLSKYVIQEKGKTVYARHPKERIYDFSRDQALCLVAGLYAQGLHYLVNLDYVDGIDIFTPANRGHFKRCAGKKANWLEDAWLWFDVWRAAKFQKLKESNQLICQMVVADKKYVKYWLKNNDQWRKSILDYWSEGAGYWRGEPELAAHMIKFLEGYL